MAPHLMRAQGAYKADKHATHTHAHTNKHPTHSPTHTHIHPHPHPHTPRKNTSIVIMGLMETEERKREISRLKRRDGFSVLTWKRRVTWHAWDWAERFMGFTNAYRPCWTEVNWELVYSGEFLSVTRWQSTSVTKSVVVASTKEAASVMSELLW